MPTLEREGVRFHYLDVGEGLPVVVQHGLGGSSLQATQIFGERPPFRMLSLDARGHGDTVPLGDPDRLSFATFADDVAAMLEHAGVERAVIGGLSMGAGISLAFARRHPERTLGLILIRPAWLDAPMPANLALFPRIAALLREHGPDVGLERFIDEDPYLRGTANPGARTLLAGQFQRPMAVERAAVLERMPADCPPHGPEAWGAVEVPALVIATADDDIHPLAFGRALADALPDARLAEPVSKWIDEEGHNRAVEAAALAFLRDRAGLS